MIEMQLTPESSQIFSIGYNPETKVLAIQFRNRATKEAGPSYHYALFPAEKFAEFQAAESKGRFFGAEIKGKFEYERQ